MSYSWIYKYAPKSLKEFVNQKQAVSKFLTWISSWKPGSKPALFYGPPGVGKTALVRAYAFEKNLDLVEMNASDVRTAEMINRVFGEAMRQQSLWKRGKIFLVDEVDGISKDDRGAIPALLKIIRQSRYPIVMTANDVWNPKLASLRQNAVLIPFSKLTVWDIVKRLSQICQKEGIAVESAVLREIASRSQDDLRAAINDLEVVGRGKKKITKEDLKVLGYRDKETQIFDALKIIFKTKSVQAARLSVMNVDKDPEEIFWWIEQNVANEYEKVEELAKAYDALSKADLFRKRIVRRQNWRYLVYMIDLMTAGVALAKKEMYRKFTKYEYPQKIKMLSITKAKRQAMENTLRILAEMLHCSTKVVKEEYLPYFKIIANHNKEFKKVIVDVVGKDGAKIIGIAT